MPPLRKPVSPNQQRSFPPSRVNAETRRAGHPKAPKEDGIASLEPDIPSEIVVDAAKYLVEKTGYEINNLSTNEKNSLFFQKYIINRSKISRSQHISRFAEAYAHYVHMRNNEELKKSALEAVEKKTGKRPNKRTCLIRLVVELMINYSDKENKAEERRAGNLHSRDVKAIRNLIQRGVTPTQVEALSLKNGEGLNSWAMWRPDVPFGDDASSGQIPNSDLDSESQKSLDKARLTPTAPDDITRDIELSQDKTVSKSETKRMGFRFPKSWPIELALSSIAPNGKKNGIKPRQIR